MGIYIYTLVGKVTQFRRALQLQVTCQKRFPLQLQVTVLKSLAITVTSYSIFS